MTDQLNIYRIPLVPPAPEGYYADAKGHLVPVSAIKPQHLLEHQMVFKVLEFACDLANQIRRFRSHVFADAATFDQLLLDEYGEQKRGRRGKGNVTYRTLDGLLKFQVQIADHIDFGPELQAARECFRACIAEWVEGAHANLRSIVDDAFEADKEGKVSRDAVFRLLRLDFDDKRWQDGQRAIKDSIRIVGSKSYCRFYLREAADAAWCAVPIDLAAA
jgi:hypothetical protein